MRALCAQVFCFRPARMPVIIESRRSSRGVPEKVGLGQAKAHGFRRLLRQPYFGFRLPSKFVQSGRPQLLDDP
jgi:hypothetical protein